TYGFPVELTEEYVKEEGMEIDYEGFKIAMEEQRERARAARQETESMKVQGGILSELHVESTFVGYDQLSLHAKVNAIIKEDQLVNEASEGDKIEFILNETPFYAESGGQIADIGYLISDDCTVRITSVQKAPKG